MSDSEQKAETPENEKTSNKAFVCPVDPAEANLCDACQ